jgi:hypothetical protein
MSKLYNLARMTSATTGTGTITLGVAVSGYLTFANAGVQNGDVLFYGIKDGAASECGYGTYTASGTTLTRNVIKSTNSNAAINLDGSEEVYITAIAGDGGDLMPSFDHPMRGFDMPINLQLNASVASSILTVAVKGNNGNDPSNSNPVLVPFRDATAANGDPVWIAVTSALSINTNAVGASLGSANGTPFRFWVVLFNNGGTAALGLINCRGTNQIFALDETSPQSTTAMSASATSAGVFYTTAALTSCAFRIIGYLEYSSGLTTAGTYASAPTKLQLFGPGIKKPGDYTGNIVQSIQTTTFAPGTANTFLSTSLAATFTLSAAMNAVEFSFCGSGICGATAVTIGAAMFRGSTQVGPFVKQCNDTAANAGVRQVLAIAPWLDFPNTTSAQSYVVKSITNSVGNGEWPFAEALGGSTSGASAIWKEVMV